MKSIHRIAITALALCLAACVPPSKKAAAPATPASAKEEVLLRYKFPPGRISRYRVEGEGTSSLSMSRAPGLKTVKAVSSLVIKEKVVQAPMNGFALIERVIESARLQVWQDNELVYDSSISGSSNRPEAEKYANLKGKIVRFEMDERGKIRNIQGSGDIYIGQNPFQTMEFMESGVPLLPEGKITPGLNWNNKKEMPFKTGEDFHGGMTMEENATLANLRTDQGSQIATLNTRQNLKINLFQGESGVPLKGFKGEGGTDGKFEFNIDEGRIVTSETHSQLKVVTPVISVASKMETTIEMQLTIKTTLIRD